MYPNNGYIVYFMTEREAALEKELSESRLENKLLQGKVDALMRLLYGSKSGEARPRPGHASGRTGIKKAEAPDPVAESDTGATPAKATRRRPEGPRILDHLPVKE
ncbi:MAG: hypothetical protein AAF546_02040 [Verrucomicrobiota bacterium]